MEELVVVLLDDDLLSDADNLAEVLDEVLSVFRELVLGDRRVSESVIESANALSAQQRTISLLRYGGIAYERNSLVVGHLSLAESFDNSIKLQFAVDVDGLDLGIRRRSDSTESVGEGRKRVLICF